MKTVPVACQAVCAVLTVFLFIQIYVSVTRPKPTTRAKIATTNKLPWEPLWKENSDDLGPFPLLNLTVVPDVNMVPGEVPQPADPILPPDSSLNIKTITPMMVAPSHKKFVHDIPVRVKTQKTICMAMYAVTRQPETCTEDYSYETFYEKAKQLKAYAQQNKYNTKYGFLVNMGAKSGKKRFFVVDLAAMTIVKSGMVAHGKGDSRMFTLDKKYSNEKGSNCTSLGIYKVGKSYAGLFGLSYKLYGLQEPNCNAYKRSIVLHSMNSIPYNEIDYPIFQTEGCPAVSPLFLKEISAIINVNSKPLLLWVFDSGAENHLLYAQK